MKEKLYDIIARTSIELGHKTDGKTLAVLTKTFAFDLETDKRFRRLTIEDVDTAFRLGVRLDTKDSFLNIRTFYRWCLAHKQRLQDAYYEVHTLGADPNKVPYYKKNLLTL
tara:strand:+ start:823 stop:1155 length:333 start_codon:yes stop_codon:yes gene_type:complete